MFSHEVKNYALLTYNGQLVVRGVALRSSRSEPFGDRFLRKALLCLLTNDIPSLHRVFLDTVMSIRNCALPASEMGTRVRLSKTPEAYQASRASHPEPQYEALLAAGRTRWYPGERVRFYRARGKVYVWLPEASEDTTIDQNRAQSDTTQQDGKPKAGTAPSRRELVGDRRDYNAEHYLNVLVTSYAARLRKAFAPEDFEQLFRVEQAGLFDQPVEDIEPRWIRCDNS